MLGRRGMGAAMTAVMVMSGCVQYKTHVVTGAPQPVSGGQPVIENQEKNGEPTASVELSGSTVEIAASEPKLCREMRSMPAVEDETTERTITKNGNLYQWGYGLGAVAFAGAGVYGIAGPCNKDISSSSPSGQQQSATRPCTMDEAKGQREVGYGLLGVGALLAIPFIINIFRGMNSTESVKTTHTDYSAWKKCGNANIKGAIVRLTLPDGTAMQAALDADGHAKLSLDDLQPSSALFANPHAQLTIDGEHAGTVPLRQLPQYSQAKTAFQQKLAAAREKEAAREARAQAEQAQRQAAAQAEQARLQKLAAKCKSGDAQVCYQLGRERVSAGVPGGEVWLRKACELNYQVGCIAYQQALENKREEEQRERAQQASEEAQREARDPWQRARRSVLAYCVVDNFHGGDVARIQGLCEQALDREPFKQQVVKSCIALCNGENMGRCNERCHAN